MNLKPLDLSKQDSEKIKTILNGNFEVEEILDRINFIINGFGVKNYKDSKIWISSKYLDTAMMYIDMRNSKSPTVIFDFLKNQFRVVSLFEWVNEYKTGWR